MKSTKIEYACDVCRVDVTDPEKRFSSDIQVIFITEQTEGRTCKPYLADKELDLCDRCLKNLFLGHAIFASRAQGNNQYYFNCIDREVLDELEKEDK